MAHQGWVQVFEPIVIADETKIQPRDEAAFWSDASSPILAPNAFVAGTRFRLYAMGKGTTAASNNGGVTIRLRWSAAGAATTGVSLASRTFVPSLANSVTDGVWEAEWKGVCRTYGTSGTMFVVGEFRSEALFASFASYAATITVPLTGPANATIDTTLARMLVMTASGTSSSVSFTTSQIELSLTT